MKTQEERYISRKTQQIIDDLRLVQYNNGISKNHKFIRQCINSTI